MFHPQQQIGPYTLIHLLGRGGFGEVWLAEKRGALMTTQVAIKLPLDPDPDLDAIREEAETWRRASGHPNVLPVMDADVYEGQVVIVSEYAAGGSLSSWLQQHGGKAPSVDAAVAMITGILAGLEYLHALKPQPIIHRDLKPDNVLIQGGLPRLTDFGISRVLKTTGQTQHASGTPHYMPPEAFAGKYSPQSDVWAAGVMLYQMLSGNLPFPQADMPSLYGAILTGTPEPLAADVPQELKAAVTTALSKNLLHRFTSSAEMQATLKRVSSHAVVPPEPYLNKTRNVTLDFDVTSKKPSRINPRKNSQHKKSYLFGIYIGVFMKVYGRLIRNLILIVLAYVLIMALSYLWTDLLHPLHSR